MTSLQPQLWIEKPGAAVDFYQRAFGAAVLHQVGDGDDIVAQLAIDTAAFWVARADPTMQRFSPLDLAGATGRILLVVDAPEIVAAAAIDAGAHESSPVQDEHGWRIGRIVDPFGHEWEIGRPLATWPPSPPSPVAP
jgi:PhnB protein